LMRTNDDPAILAGRTVLLTSDPNVPMAAGVSTDRGRVLASAGTIRELAEAGPRVIVMSHLGPPKRQPDPQFSLLPIVPEPAAAIDREVAFAADTVGDEARAKAAELQAGEVLLL